MDSEEAAILEAACLSALGIPFTWVFLWNGGLPVGVKVVAQKS